MLFQGDVINNIEKHVGTAVDYVCSAKGETKKAVVYQKRARRVSLNLGFFKSSRSPATAAPDQQPSEVSN